jgi:outer membrane protein assembly factor BamB
MLYENRIYIAGGHYVEDGEGSGRLCCVDPTKRGDISLELPDGPGKGKPNPNSGAVWHFDEIHRTMFTMTAHDGLVIAPDLSGFVYCLDARTGQKYWKQDLNSHVFGCSPLIADGKVHIGDEDGELCVFALVKEKKLIAKHETEEAIFSSPVLANGVLYIIAGDTLFAIQNP